MYKLVLWAGGYYTILAGFLALMLVLVACSPDQPLASVPTVPVTPVLPTATPPPPTPTNTPEPRLSPLDLLTATPESASARITELVRADVQMRTPPGDMIEDVYIQAMRWDATLPRTCEPIRATSPRPIDGFLVIITAGEKIYRYHTDEAQTLVLCAIYTPHNVPVDIRLMIDPLAMELAALAQRRLATEYDILERRVQVIDITPYLWQDASLGCPDPRQTYAPQVISGYRLVMQVGEARHAFHTDSSQLRPCPDGREVLPMLEATPDAP